MKRIECKEIIHQGVRALSIGNGKVKLIASLNFGIRILSFGFEGGANLFYENLEHYKDTDKSKFKLYGGHRLWNTPEEEDRMAMPDNEPVEYQIKGNEVTFTQKTDGLGIIKRITVSLDANKATVKHEIENSNYWDIETSLWALSQMDLDGLAVVPQCDKDTGLAPNRRLIIWPYSDLKDERFTLGKKLIFVKADKRMDKSFKFGCNADKGFAAYFKDGVMFVKTFKHEEDYEYADMGSSFEIYVNGSFLELESFSPLELILRGGVTEHTEEWLLFDGVNAPAVEDEEAFLKIFTEKGLM